MSLFISEEAYTIIRRIQKNNKICFLQEIYQEPTVEMETRDLHMVVFMYKSQEYHSLHYFLQETYLPTSTSKNTEEEKYHLRECIPFSQMTNEKATELSFQIQKETPLEPNHRNILEILSSFLSKNSKPETLEKTFD
jgi:hypothetical protein